MTAKPSLLRIPRAWLLAASAAAALGTAAVQPALAQSGDAPENDVSNIKKATIAAHPLYAAMAGDRPTMVLVPSVEYPTVGAQYMDANGYSPANEYLGYYNHVACYKYNDGEKYFEITTLPDLRNNEKGAYCSGDYEFSGNFLNWATSSTMDMMRLALTGGDRVVDTKSKTVLQRAYLPDGSTVLTDTKGAKGETDGKGYLSLDDTAKKTRGPDTFFNHSALFPNKWLTLEQAEGAVPEKMRSQAEASGGIIYIANIANRIYFSHKHENTWECGSQKKECNWQSHAANYTLGEVITRGGDVSGLPDAPNVSDDEMWKLSDWIMAVNVDVDEQLGWIKPIGVDKQLQLLKVCEEGEWCDVGDKQHQIYYGSPHPTPSDCSDRCGGDTPPSSCNYCSGEDNKNKRYGGWETAVVKGKFKCTNRENGEDSSLIPYPGKDAETDPTHLDTAPRQCLVVRTKDDGDSYLFARVKVCDSKDVRDYPFCTEYPNNGGKPIKKPTGVIQRYADNLRLAAFGYAIQHTAPHMRDNFQGRFGGVLRAPMKYVGKNTYSPTGVKDEAPNPKMEWEPETGILIPDPEGIYETDADTSGIALPEDLSDLSKDDKVSGVINYFNRFGRNPKNPGAYKEYDPVGELYYEALRYMQGLPPSKAAVKDLDDYMKDGFPIYTDWSNFDPFDAKRYNETANYTCLNNSILVIGDVNTGDPTFSDPDILRATMRGDNTGTLPGTSETPDPAKNELDIAHWRDVVWSFETKGSVEYKDGSGQTRTASGPNPAFSDFSLEQLDKWRKATKGGFNYENKDYSWYYGLQFNSYIPGMAYWAHTHDIRGENWTDGSNKGTKDSKVRPGLRLTSYFFDVNESGRENPYDKRIGKEADSSWGNPRGNQFWLGAKYGGFLTSPMTTDSTAYNTTGNPFYLTASCTKDDDGNETCTQGMADDIVWSDKVKAQGSNTNGFRNPEPRTYYMPSSGRDVLAAFDAIFGAQKPPANRSIGGAAASGGLSSTSFQATFDGERWSGNVEVERFSQVPEGCENDPDVKCTGWKSSTDLEGGVAGQLPAAENRHIYMGKRTCDESESSCVPCSDGKHTCAFAFTTSTTEGTPADVRDALKLPSDDDENEEAMNARIDARINWLRGDRSNDTEHGGSLRARDPNSVIGDILNSGVSFVGPPAGQVNLGEGYDAFVTAQENRISAIYVGANDGMLHAFEAGRKNPETGETEVSGTELFAYIPSWMKDKLAALTYYNYIHQPYVDATPVIGDAKLHETARDSNGAVTESGWRTVLVGGTGGGGKGVYALDVTNPEAPTASGFDANNLLLWEFTDKDDPDMGYVLGRVRIVKLLYTAEDTTTTPKTPATYRWFAMVPGGVNSYENDNTTANGDANIFLLALDKPANAAWEQGTNYWKIALPRIQSLEDEHPTGLLNLEAFTGLGSVTEYVYAGDLHGQLWALKFKNVPASDWNPVSLAGNYVNGVTCAYRNETEKKDCECSGAPTIAPLFVAFHPDSKGNDIPQPITVAPTIVQGEGNGQHFVGFGTGKYFEEGDAQIKPGDSFYTVYSNFNSSACEIKSLSEGATDARPNPGVIPNRSYLQEVTKDAGSSTEAETYFKADNSFYWGWISDPTASTTGSDAAEPYTRSGWFHDFTEEAEREVADASWIPQTSRLMFGTLIPNSATNTGLCGTGGGKSMLYTFDMVSGKGVSRASVVGLLSQPLVFFDEPTETKADSTGRRLRISPVFSGQFGSDGSGTEKVDTVIVPFGRLSWRRIDNFQQLKNASSNSETSNTGEEE